MKGQIYKNEGLFNKHDKFNFVLSKFLITILNQNAKFIFNFECLIF